jgi:hypothetical protein
VERQACKSYVIVSRNQEIAQSEMPALGGHALGQSHLPLYTRIAGSGDAWVNLHLADATIKKQRHWHGKYSLYCIGEHSRPTASEPKDEVECEGFSGHTKVYAIG